MIVCENEMRMTPFQQQVAKDKGIEIRQIMVYVDGIVVDSLDLITSDKEQAMLVASNLESVKNHLKGKFLREGDSLVQRGLYPSRDVVKVDLRSTTYTTKGGITPRAEVD
jgi:hypothetical protein